MNPDDRFFVVFTKDSEFQRLCTVLDDQDWRKLGEELGYNRQILDSLEEKDKKTESLLRRWQHGRSATMENLLIALQEIDNQTAIDIVNEVWDKHPKISLVPQDIPMDTLVNTFSSVEKAQNDNGKIQWGANINRVIERMLNSQQKFEMEKSSQLAKVVSDSMRMLLKCNQRNLAETLVDNCFSLFENKKVLGTELGYVWFAKGKLASNQERLHTAVKCLKEAVKCFVEQRTSRIRAEVLNTLGNTHYRMNEKDNARACYDQAIEILASDPCKELGLVYLSWARFYKGAADYNKAFDYVKKAKTIFLSIKYQHGWFSAKFTKLRARIKQLKVAPPAKEVETLTELQYELELLLTSSWVSDSLYFNAVVVNYQAAKLCCIQKRKEDAKKYLSKVLDCFEKLEQDNSRHTLFDVKAKTMYLKNCLEGQATGEDPVLLLLDGAFVENPERVLQQLKRLAEGNYTDQSSNNNNSQ